MTFERGLGANDTAKKEEVIGIINKTIEGFLNADIGNIDVKEIANYQNKQETEVKKILKGIQEILKDMKKNQEKLSYVNEIYDLLSFSSSAIDHNTLSQSDNIGDLEFIKLATSRFRQKATIWSIESKINDNDKNLFHAEKPRFDRDQEKLFLLFLKLINLSLENGILEPMIKDFLNSSTLEQEFIKELGYHQNPEENS